MSIQIDGSFGEGGGQILRTALALAAILKRPVHIKNIRGGRKKPGLRPQHLAAVRALAQITSARVEGAEPGSMLLHFEPRQLESGTYSLDVGTAGSTSLVLQAIIPGMLFSGGPSQVNVTGGTHVAWSPCFHYLEQVFAPAVGDMGADIRFEIEHWGWYPKGGGKVTASISPVERLGAVDRTRRGGLHDIRVLSAVSNLPTSIGKRQQDQALKRLAKKGHNVGQVQLVEAPSLGAGTAVFIVAEFEKAVAGFTSLGKRGKPAERVADEACSHFFKFMAAKAGVDAHLADQLVLYMALAEGSSSFVARSFTEHLLTNIWVIEQFLPVKFEVDKKTASVSVEGVGFSGSTYER